VHGTEKKGSCEQESSTTNTFKKPQPRVSTFYINHHQATYQTQDDEGWWWLIWKAKTGSWVFL